MQVLLRLSKKKVYLQYQSPQKKGTMVTTELETPKLRRQVINKVNRLDSKSLTKLLYIIDNFDNYQDKEDDEIEIDIDFPTPQTPEEARKEIEEIEEEIKQGKFITHKEGMAMIDKMIEDYGTRMVG